MSEIQTEFLFEMRLAVTGPFDCGSAGSGDRRFAVVTGGRFEGPRLKGEVLNGGSDALLVQPGGRTLLDVRAVLQTDDGARIYVTYRGVRNGPAPVMARLAAGEAVDPAEYYFRTALFFETGDARYAWLNDIVGVGTGRREKTGPIYRVFAVR